MVARKSPTSSFNVLLDNVSQALVPRIFALSRSPLSLDCLAKLKSLVALLSPILPTIVVTHLIKINNKAIVDTAIAMHNKSTLYISIKIVYNIYANTRIINSSNNSSFLFFCAFFCAMTIDKTQPKKKQTTTIIGTIILISMKYMFSPHLNF
jgi:hypothetical protein